MILIDALKRYVGSIILNKSQVRSEGNNKRKVEVEIPSAAFLLLGKNPIENAEQLYDSLFATGRARSWMLYGERMNTAIMTSHTKTSMAYAVTADNLYSGQEPVNANETLVIVPVLFDISTCKVTSLDSRLLTKRYCPGTSTSSNFWNPNSLRCGL